MGGVQAGQLLGVVMRSATCYTWPMKKTPIATAASAEPPDYQSPPHPGPFVRTEILKPRGLSVVQAAKLMGVSRPALSNFLNGHVLATTEMASRVEAAFGFPASKLLDMQAKFDAGAASTVSVSASVTPYTVPFLGIKARDIESWATRNIPARSRFAVLLRTLVHSTGRAVTRIDFPGNDDAERPGWDGQLEVVEGTPWIPAGLSGWEFGTNEDPKAKAEGDYRVRTKAVPKADRSALTFVFVTPRVWQGKDEWSARMRAKREWRDVRAYDVSDLEQWIEQSIAAQVWFAHEEGRETHGVRTLSQCWCDWADVAEHSLPGSLFAPAIEGAKKTILSCLAQQPTKPIVVMADSTDEALAFVAQFFETLDDPRVLELRDRVLVFDEPGTAKKLAQGTQKFVAVVHSREVESALAALKKPIPLIVAYPRNAVNVDADVVLEPLSYEHFRASLEATGFSRDEITRLDNESGRSLTVLRRRLARSPGVRLPEWASDAATASSLVSFLFVGSWNARRTADQAILTLLAGEEPYDALEKKCQALTRLNDPPIWSAGHYRGVVSKLDVLFAIAGAVTRDDLERFFAVAHIVLGEDDPKLDLPHDEQWAAAIYGKSREFSGPLRGSIAETLVLLSIHGNHLFLGRLGLDCEAQARKLVRTLLTPLKTRLLEANNTDLTAYAEAAPDEFLSILEEDLRMPEPETYGLLRPAGDLFGGGCPRTGLLWALEDLSWSPSTMPRAALILAQLSQVEINDNWANRPIHSLQAIFRAWWPQTAADHEKRFNAVRQIAGRFPSIAWTVCIEQLNTRLRIGTYSHKPKWRNDGHGYGEPLRTLEPVMVFVRDILEMVLQWERGYTTAMIGDLVNCLPTVAPEHRERVWSITEEWATTASDADKAIVREQIRKRVIHRRAKRQSNNEDYVALTESAKRVRDALQPANILYKHEWLFRNHWVEESDEELADGEFDYKKREARTATLRTVALREVHEARGTAGVVELADLGDAHYVVGYLYADKVLEEDAVPGAFRVALEGTDASKMNTRRLLMTGLIDGCGAQAGAILDRLAGELSENNFLRVLLAAPFRPETWCRVDALTDAARRAYWSAVIPDRFLDGDEVAIEAVERLIDAKRPRTAFQVATYKLNNCDPELLFCLMTALATDADELEGHIIPQQYYIEEAFARIDQATAITLEQKAELEYLYIDVLANPHTSEDKCRIPNLTQYVELHPEFYVQAIVYAYPRNDGAIDPPEFAVPAEQSARFAEQGHKLLRGMETVPGRDETGQITVEGLRDWVKAVRDGSKELSRLNFADITIGELLSHAPLGTDAIWPCEPVRDVLEEVQSDAMMNGVRTGLFNARGWHLRGEGGAQEWNLADQYRTWADELRYSHPYVSSRLLMELAKTYEDDARREDTDAIVRRRLR